MGWFLNSGQSLLTILLSLSAVAAGTSALSQRYSISGTIALSIGATVAMIIVLFNIGPGNLFPIAIVMGSVFLGIAAFAGMGIGIILRHVFMRRRS